MISFDIRTSMFQLIDDLLSEVIPNYQHQLKELNIKLDYLWLDRTVQSSMSISMVDRAIWYYSLDEVMDEAYEQGFISEKDLEDFGLQYHLDIKL